MAFEFIFGGVFAILLAVFMFVDSREFWLPLFWGAILLVGNVFIFSITKRLSFVSPYNGFFLCLLTMANGIAIVFTGQRKKMSVKELAGGLIFVFGFVAMLFSNAFAREAISLANTINRLF